MYMYLYIFTQFIYIYTIYIYLTLSRTESSYPPNLVDNKKIHLSYFVIIYDNKIITVYKKW